MRTQQKTQRSCPELHSNRHHMQLFSASSAPPPPPLPTPPSSPSGLLCITSILQCSLSVLQLLAGSRARRPAKCLSGLWMACAGRREYNYAAPRNIAGSHTHDKLPAPPPPLLCSSPPSLAFLNLTYPCKSSFFLFFLFCNAIFPTPNRLSSHTQCLSSIPDKWISMGLEPWETAENRLGSQDLQLRPTPPCLSALVLLYLLYRTCVASFVPHFPPLLPQTPPSHLSFSIFSCPSQGFAGAA